MKTYAIILSTICLMISNLAYAQVVLPSLDPTLPVELAAAASWRFGSTIGGGVAYGTQKANDEQVDTTTLSNLSEMEGVGAAYLFAYQPTAVTFEASGNASEIDYRWDGSDNTTDHVEQYKASSAYFKMAIRGNNRVSVGIEYRSEQYKFEDSTSTTKQSHYGGSFGMRFMDNLFISAGINRFTEKDASYDSDMKWQEVIGGIAFQLGAPDQSMLRLEGSIGISEESKTTVNGLDYYRRKVTTTQGSAEVLFSGFLLTFRNRNDVYHEVDSIPLSTERKVNRSRVGLGYRSPGFAAVLYAENRVEEQNGNKYDTQYLGATMSFSFM